MKLTYKIQFFSDWHCGSGLSSGTDLNALVIRDKNGLPFIPGKTIKGLLREALEDINKYSKADSSNWIIELLGKEGTDMGVCFFENAELNSELKKEIIKEKQTKSLYRKIASTKIESTGVAKGGSLRKMDTVIPCELTGGILYIPDSNEYKDRIKKGLSFIKQIGQNRNRGLGKCQFYDFVESVDIDVSTDKKSIKSNNKDDISVLFECSLLTDIVINQKAATEGNQNSLDFIPGNNFLGIVAGGLYFKSTNNAGRLSKEDSLTVFHSGKVRFGDAHPLYKKEGKYERTLKVPASYYHSKQKDKDGFYIHHEVVNPEAADFIAFQPKQCRNGFYFFDETDKKGYEVKVKKTFALKSEYDRNTRKSKDQKMFGYESLPAGSSWLFEISFDGSISKEIINKVVNSIIGQKKIGRSRTAQYGLVEINYVSEKFQKEETIKDSNHVLLYADSRLIFFDEYGLPTFQPVPEQLGFDGGKIIWKNSQIRTFQYAPWNSTRQVRDTDRCGIEKGSVFYIETNKNSSITVDLFVGEYKNEGFGKIILNPEWLKAQESENEKMKETINGKAAYNLEKGIINNFEMIEQTTMTPEDRHLLEFLSAKGKQIEKERDIFNLVSDFTNDTKVTDTFGKNKFASQWGNIRNYAVKYGRKQNDCNPKGILEEKLFDKNDGYFMKGVAAKKWDSMSRTLFKEKFFDKLTEENCQLALINLATEMAKKSGGN